MRNADALIERDTPTQRLYAQQDGNWNVTALIDTSGNVQERYIYDPYGAVTILDPNWSVRSSSSFAWIYLHQGGRYDSTSGLYNFRNRDYSPTLGRWTETDPMGLGAGDANLYRAVGNNPTNGLDPLGLQSFPTQGAMPVLMPDGSVRWVKPGNLPPEVQQLYRQQGMMHHGGPNTLRPADLSSFVPRPGPRPLSEDERLD